MDYVNLEWLIEAYTASPQKETFFKTASFTLHAGTEELQKQIESGYTFKKIRAAWFPDIAKFKKIRSQYLLYDE